MCFVRNVHSEAVILWLYYYDFDSLSLPDHVLRFEVGPFFAGRGKLKGTSSKMPRLTQVSFVCILRAFPYALGTGALYSQRLSSWLPVSPSYQPFQPSQNLLVRI